MKTNFLLAMTVLLFSSVQVAPQTAAPMIKGSVKLAGSNEPVANAQITVTVAAPVQPVTVRISGGTGNTNVTETISQAIANVSSETGQPLVLTPAQPSAGPGPFNAVSDAAGNFQITGVPPGRYTVAARHEGLVGRPQENGVSPLGPTVTVNLNGGVPSLPDITLWMVRGATVEGRITGPDGRPISGMAVTPYLFTYRDGDPYIVQGGTARTTDDRGQYRLFWLGPGEYFIAAVPARLAGVPPREVLARTFYPGTIEPSAASPLSIVEGAELSAINIAIQSTRVYTIKGRAVNPLPHVTPRRFPNGDMDTSVPSFALAPRGTAIRENTPAQLQNPITSEAGRRNGDFEIRGVRPGLYDLFPVLPALLNGQQLYASGRIPVEVRDSDVEGIVVPIDAGSEFNGRIRVIGETDTLKTESLRVALSPLDNIPAPLPARIAPQPVDSSGAFAIRNVPEATYTLTVSPLPAGAFIADIREDGKSVFDAGIVAVAAKQSTRQIEIVIDTNGQTLEGVVLDDKQQPVSGASVALVPPSGRRQNAALYRAAKSDAEGKFKLTGVATGEFKNT
jgi:hypothetical protein